jgi:hypothetical protein
MTYIAITIGPGDWPWIVGALFLVIVLLSLWGTR